MTSVLTTLPYEVLLEIASNMPLSSLHAFKLASKACYELCCQYESYLYHNAAYLHRFIPSPEVTLNEALETFSGSVKDGVSDWKAYCQLRARIEKGWMGRAPSTKKAYNAPGDHVHRIKVDEQRGFIITTYSEGGLTGLTVTDIATDTALWTFDTDYCTPSTHCEYDNGFLVIDRHAGQIDIWRWAAEFEDDPPQVLSPPDDFMEEAFEEAENRHPTTSLRFFRPWALLELGWVSAAFRLSYPSLIVAGYTQFSIFDVRTTETLTFVEDDDLFQDCGYVDVNDQYAFICNPMFFSVYSREDGRRKIHLDYEKSFKGKRIFMDTDSSRKAGYEIVPNSADVTLVEAQMRVTPIKFHAAHVSSCGSHLVILRNCYGLCVIRNFEDVILHQVPLADVTFNIVLPFWNERDSQYLAVGEDRFAIASGMGVFILTLEPEEHLLGPPDQSNANDDFPPFVVSQCPSVTSPEPSSVPCLQMTRSHLVFSLGDASSDARLYMINVSPFL